MRNIETESVSLATFQEEHNKTLSAFYLPENQMGYSPLPEQSLRYCDEDPDRHPIVVLVDEVPVVFLFYISGKLSLLLQKMKGRFYYGDFLSIITIKARNMV